MQVTADDDAHDLVGRVERNLDVEVVRQLLGFVRLVDHLRSYRGCVNTPQVLEADQTYQSAL
ncbi:hypothetical protein D3C80_2058160 [compost metagenome]